MGQLTFQANLGGAVNLIGPNIANTLNLTLPSVDGSAGYPLLTSGAGVLSFGQIALGSAVSGTLPVANGGTGVTTSTGSGSNVLSTSPTLVTPILGTPTSVTLTNATGLPLSTGVTGTLATTNGGTGLTSFTANGVVYASSTSALTTGSALTFDGTSLKVTGGNAGQLTLDNGGQQYTQLSLQRNSSLNTGGDLLVDGTNSLFYFRSLAANMPFVWSLSASAGSPAEQMRLTSTGLGIGTSSPGAKLESLVTSTTTPALRLRYNSTSYYLDALMNANGDAVLSVPALNGVTSGQLKLQTNGGYALMDSSGNLGLGVTPSAATLGPAFQIANGAVLQSLSGGYTELSNNAIYNSGFKYISSSTATLYEQGAGAHKWYTAPSGTAGNAISFTQAMTLDASGNLLVGTTSAAYGASGRGVIEVGGGSTAIMALKVSGSGVGYTYHDGTAMSLWNVANGNLLFGTNNTERARIDSSGNLLVAKNASNINNVGVENLANGAVLSTRASSTNDDSSYNLYSTGATAYRFYVGMGGTVYATSTTITAISDQRLKENIRDLDEGLATVMALKPRKFDWKEGKGQNIKNARGFIAQEFETVLPDMIEEWRDPAPEGEEAYKAINANLIPTLVKAIQEQQAIITDLRARVAQLESKGA